MRNLAERYHGVKSPDVTTLRSVYGMSCPSVQKRATKLIPVLKNLPYKDRLKAYYVCNMSTLHYRRVRRDMIETYKACRRMHVFKPVRPFVRGSVLSSVTKLVNMIF